MAMALTLSWRQAIALTGTCFLASAGADALLSWAAVPWPPAAAPWVATAAYFLGFVVPAALFASAADVRLPLGLPRAPRWWAWTLGALLLAVPLALLQRRLILWLAGFLPSVFTLDLGSRAAGGWPVWVAVALAPALAEELVFRGLIQPALVARWGAWPGLVLTALLFCACHVEPREALGLLPLALTLGWFTWRSRGLAPAVALHLAYNSALLLL